MQRLNKGGICRGMAREVEGKVSKCGIIETGKESHLRKNGELPRRSGQWGMKGSIGLKIMVVTEDHSSLGLTDGLFWGKQVLLSLPQSPPLPPIPSNTWPEPHFCPVPGNVYTSDPFPGAISTTLQDNFKTVIFLSPNTKKHLTLCLALNKF